MLNLLINSTKV